MGSEGSGDVETMAGGSVEIRSGFLFTVAMIRIRLFPCVSRMRGLCIRV